MNQVQMNIIIDELNEISKNLYDGTIDGVDASYQIDKLIDELEKAKKYLPSGL